VVQAVVEVEMETWWTKKQILGLSEVGVEKFQDG
jgi:hypothetical protein